MLCKTTAIQEKGAYRCCPIGTRCDGICLNGECKPYGAKPGVCVTIGTPETKGTCAKPVTTNKKYDSCCPSGTYCPQLCRARFDPITHQYIQYCPVNCKGIAYQTKQKGTYSTAIGNG